MPRNRTGISYKVTSYTGDVCVRYPDGEARISPLSGRELYPTYLKSRLRLNKLAVIDGDLLTRDAMETLDRMHSKCVSTLAS